MLVRCAYICLLSAHFPHATPHASQLSVSPCSLHAGAPASGMMPCCAVILLQMLFGHVLASVLYISLLWAHLSKRLQFKVLIAPGNLRAHVLPNWGSLVHRRAHVLSNLGSLVCIFVLPSSRGCFLRF